MARIVIKAGDIFSVVTGEGQVKFFQYIGNDDSQLGSEVIRVFKKLYQSSESIDFALVTTGEIDFHAHCILKLGVRMDFWTKVGKASIRDEGLPLFRDTYDYGRAAWQEPIKVSSNWIVWSMGQPFQKVGLLKDENQKADIGLVMNPDAVVHRMIHGSYNMPFYPSF